MIQRLYVHNFRCLENFDLDLSRSRTAVVIGNNGSGKSTIGCVLNVLHQVAQGINRVGELVKPSDLTRGQSDVPIRIEIEVLLNEILYKYSVVLELPEGFKEMRINEESLIVGDISVFSRKIALVSMVNFRSGAETRFNMDWHLFALPLIQELSTEDPLFLFKNWLKRMLIISPVPSLITGDSEGEIISPNNYVSNFGDWFTGLITNSPSSYSSMEKYLKDTLIDFRDIKNPIIGTDSRSIVVQFEQNGKTISVPFRFLSDGEKCFFIAASVLASNQSYDSLFCFWDEPDNYLSLSEIGHFVLNLRRSFENSGQMIIVSHNPEAVLRFSDESTFVIQRKSHIEPPSIRLLKDIGYQGDLLSALVGGEI